MRAHVSARQRLTVFSFPVRNKREKTERPSSNCAVQCNAVCPRPSDEKRSSLSVRYANSDLHVGGRTALRNKEALVMIDLASPTMPGRLFGMGIAIDSLCSQGISSYFLIIS